MKPLKDRYLLNYLKVKWQRYPLVITVLGMLTGAMLYFLTCFIIHSIQYKPKVGDIVILGENGSMKFAKAKDSYKDDIELGIITSVDDSVCYTVISGKIKDINTVDLEF